MNKVGSIEERGSKHRFSYSQVKFDLLGWADANEYLPEDYDLVQLKTNEEKVYPGWIIGTKWEGYRVKDDLSVTHWRRADPCCRERLRAKSLISS